MLYSTFLAAVNACLGPDGVRRGIEAFRTQHITNALIDLQRYIPSYRLGNSATYTAANLTVESQAMVGIMPVGAKAKAFYIFSTGPNDDPNCKRYKLDYYPWARRQDILCGRLDFPTWWGGCCWGCGGTVPPCPGPAPTPDPNNPNPFSWCESKAYVYSISPHLDSFVIYPALNPYDSLLLVWDGYKTTFNPSDVVPYPMEASEAVASYVQAKIHRLIYRDMQQAEADQNDYLKARRALIREYQENRTTDGEDNEYLSPVLPPPGQSLLTAGAEPLVFLQNITAIGGASANCLQAVLTAGLTVPLEVIVNIGGLDQYWILKSGTDATDIPNGIVQAADFSTSGFVWYQQAGV